MHSYIKGSIDRLQVKSVKKKLNLDLEHKFWLSTKYGKLWYYIIEFYNGQIAEYGSPQQEQSAFQPEDFVEFRVTSVVKDEITIEPTGGSTQKTATVIGAPNNMSGHPATFALRYATDWGIANGKTPEEITVAADTLFGWLQANK